MMEEKTFGKFGELSVSKERLITKEHIVLNNYSVNLHLYSSMLMTTILTVTLQASLLWTT